MSSSVYHHTATDSPLARMRDALTRHEFFKLIGGGSFTEAGKLEALVRAYARAGCDCIDIAPDEAVLAAADRALGDLARPPAVMVSLPLDPDPHFRKIDLDDPACIRCGACLPVCPTEAITLPDALMIAQDLCYGCGRCVPVCPTEALALLPFQVEAQIETALSHPRVQAVEIHSRYVDLYMLEAFFIRWQALLADKLISLCFRPQNLSPAQILDFVRTAGRFSPAGLMLQIDGAPMSGTDDPEASRPALEAAVLVSEIFARAGEPLPPLTVSGGINQHTATLLQDPRYATIAGVGMGTVARRLIWNLSEEMAATTALAVVAAFQKQSRPECAIMRQEQEGNLIERDSHSEKIHAANG